MPLTRLCLQNAANKIMSLLIPNSGNTGKYWQNADILCCKIIDGIDFSKKRSLTRTAQYAYVPQSVTRVTIFEAVLHFLWWCHTCHACYAYHACHAF